MEEGDNAAKVGGAADSELVAAVDTILDYSKGTADAPEPIGDVRPVEDLGKEQPTFPSKSVEETTDILPDQQEPAATSEQPVLSDTEPVTPTLEGAANSLAKDEAPSAEAAAPARIPSRKEPTAGEPSATAPGLEAAVTTPRPPTASRDSAPKSSPYRSRPITPSIPNMTARSRPSTAATKEPAAEAIREADEAPVPATSGILKAADEEAAAPAEAEPLQNTPPEDSKSAAPAVESIKEEKVAEDEVVPPPAAAAAIAPTLEEKAAAAPAESAVDSAPVEPAPVTVKDESSAAEPESSLPEVLKTPRQAPDAQDFARKISTKQAMAAQELPSSIQAPLDTLPIPTPAPVAATKPAAPAVADARDVKEYLDSTVVPVLREGLRLLAKERPTDPFEFLGDFIKAHR